MINISLENQTFPWYCAAHIRECYSLSEGSGRCSRRTGTRWLFRSQREARTIWGNRRAQPEGWRARSFIRTKERRGDDNNISGWKTWSYSSVKHSLCKQPLGLCEERGHSLHNVWPSFRLCQLSSQRCTVWCFTLIISNGDAVFLVFTCMGQVELLAESEGQERVQNSGNAAKLNYTCLCLICNMQLNSRHLKTF